MSHADNITFAESGHVMKSVRLIFLKPTLNKDLVELFKEH